MKQVGLDPDLRRHVRKYSLGMRQRLGLAQAIMENPKILILDEPFNGLDKEGVAEMREYLLGDKEQGNRLLFQPVLWYSENSERFGIRHRYSLFTFLF